MARRKRRTLSPQDWQDLPDEELLALRIRDLGLAIEGSWLQPRVEQLYAELDARGVTCHPPCYLSDEWLTPDMIPVIGVPFWLAHPRLMQLERKMMLEVEGGTDEWCMKILRHECGHALNYAYRLYRRTQWRKLFGNISEPYHVDDYVAKPYSRRYVVHLADNYAQAHPDEDFAETFAVCLNPDSNWRKRFAGWPAIRKLNYVDHLIDEMGAMQPVNSDREELAAASRMRSTLSQYYDRRRRYLQEGFPGFYDPGLQKLFASDAGASAERASVFLRRHRRQLISSVCMWTGDRKFDVHALIRLMIRRCDELGLRVVRSEQETLSGLAAFVTASMLRVHHFQEELTPR